MNSVNITGRLTRDPEIRATQSGASIARMGIAVDDYQKTNFFNVTAFGKSAEFAEKYLKKGTKIEVTGRLDSNTWEKDGQKRTDVSVIADRLSFAESKAASQKVETPEHNGFMPIPDDIDIPFN